MKLEMFFEKFDQFADAPDAVAKMRELVLDVAVRGKLVVQNVTDEPATQLLKRVLAEKNRRTGRSERSDEESGTPPDDEAFEIPRNWEWIGATTPALMVSDQGKKVQTKDILEAGKYPVVDQGKMFIRGYCDDSDKVISVAEPIVLFGDHTRETKFIDFDFVVGADGVKLLQPICIDPRFYFLVLRWLPLESRGYARHFKLLKAARIPLPPLAEQKRIVAKVDELMALCDRLGAQHQERETRHAALARASLARFADAPTPANLHFIFHNSFHITPADLRKTILTLAVQGDLSAGSSDPAEWSTVTMKEVCDLITDGEHATPQRIPSGVPLATAKNVRDGFLEMAQTDYVAPETAEKCWKRCKPKHGDILMVCVGATTGRVCLVTNPPDMVLVRSVALLRPSTKRIEAAFLDLFLRSPSGQAQIWGGVRQNAQPCLYLGKMSEFTIQLPPLAEQRRIVAKVEQLMNLVDELEQQLAASRATAAKLLTALVAELTQSPGAMPT